MELVENEDNLAILAGAVVVGFFICIAFIIPLLFPQFRLGAGGLQDSMPETMLVIVPVFQCSVIAIVATAVIFSVNRMRQQRKNPLMGGD